MSCRRKEMMPFAQSSEEGSHTSRISSPMDSSLWVSFIEIITAILLRHLQASTQTNTKFKLTQTLTNLG